MRSKLALKALFILATSLLLGIFLMHDVLPSAPVDVKYFFRLAIVTFAMVLMELFILAIAYMGIKFIRLAKDVKDKSRA
ncbi:MAG: hypothetical protein PHE67_00270 [Campylobacterales bacterium]|nr:hypothetical protein [Campylobacterales bacterium]